MGAYYASGADTNTDETTIIQVRQPASALKRLKVTYIEVFSYATADNAWKIALQRTTANGTDGTTPTAQKRDPADGAASATVGVAHSVEPTYTAGEIPLTLGGHQRSTVQWYASPGHEIVVPVTNNVGLGAVVKEVSATFTQEVGIEWEE